MARIRTIKPDMFRHEGLFQAESQTGLPLRVAFPGLFASLIARVVSAGAQIS